MMPTGIKWIIDKWTLKEDCEKLTVQEIAKKYGVSDGPVYVRLAMWGLRAIRWAKVHKPDIVNKVSVELRERLLVEEEEEKNQIAALPHSNRPNLADPFRNLKKGES